MFFEGPTIGFNGFSVVFKFLRAMVNDGFDVNDGLDVMLMLYNFQRNELLPYCHANFNAEFIVC